MRFVSGIVMGVILTIGVAYIVDAMHSAPGTDAVASPKMVNWTVVDANMRGLSTDIQDGWTRPGRRRQRDR